ncbi:Uncharacterised protein [Mycobacterium tuberculosis]|nr:Uncharacterised protein [Mycobacterium tuberculosis]
MVAGVPDAEQMKMKLKDSQVTFSFIFQDMSDNW